MTRSKKAKEAKQGLNYLSRLPMVTDKFKDVFEELAGGSDRACAIVGSTLVEHGLIDLITSVMTIGENSDTNRSNEFVEIFFDPGSPLATFSAKTRIANALGLLGNDLVKNDIDRIRKIRNVFAHSVLRLDFKNEIIDAEMKAINISYCENSQIKDLDKLDQRKMFIFCVMEIYLYLREQKSIIMKTQNEIIKSSVRLWPCGATFREPARVLRESEVGS